MTSAAAAYAPDGDALSIAGASASTGVSIDTLRYYEGAGAVPPISRSSGGQRLYTEDDLGWIRFVTRMRATGMPMRAISHYVSLFLDGAETVAARKKLLSDHRATILLAIDELRDAHEILDRKIAHYEAAERGEDLDCGDEPMRNLKQLSP